MRKTDEKRQLSIFMPSLNVLSRLKKSMRTAIQSGELSRAQVTDRLNELAKIEGVGGTRGSRITTAALDGWLASEKSNMMPLPLLPCFCRVVNSIEPLKILAASLGAAVISEEEQKLLDLAKIDQEVKRLSRRKRMLANEIEG